MALKTVFFTLVSLSFISFNAYSKEKVILDAEDDWAPYSSKVNGVAEGFAEEVIKAAFAAAAKANKDMDVDVQFNVVSYAKCTDDITKNAATSGVAGCFDTARSAANEKDYSWPATPLFKAKVFIWARKDYKGNDLKYVNLKGQKVGMTNGYEYGAEFDGGPAGEVTKDVGATDQVLFKKLLQARYDLAVAYEFPAKVALSQADMSKEKEGVKSVGTLSDLELYVSFSKEKKYQKYLDIYNVGMKEIMKNGTYKTLSDALAVKYK